MNHAGACEHKSFGKPALKKAGHMWTWTDFDRNCRLFHLKQFIWMQK